MFASYIGHTVTVQYLINTKASVDLQTDATKIDLDLIKY